MLKIRIALAIFTSLFFLSACANDPDLMPPTQVDIFVLDLSLSNDKNSQLRRLNEDLSKSLTTNGLGIPKQISNEPISGPITTIFTFVEEAATRVETFKIQDAESTIKLWNNEFSRDKERNAKGWLQVSNAYGSYLQQKLNSPQTFTFIDCKRDLNSNLIDKFSADLKRERIVNALCEKLEKLIVGFSSMQDYVASKKATQTDIFGMLAKVDRLVEQIKKQDPESKITVNIGSDMQHETGGGQDTPTKLQAINLKREKSCEVAREDREQEGLSFDTRSVVKVSGIGNAQVSAEFGKALIRYWECFFPTAEIR